MSGTRLGVWQPHRDFHDQWVRRLLRRKGFAAQRVRTWWERSARDPFTDRSLEQMVAGLQV